MDLYEINKHKLEYCVCENPNLPCICGYMNSEYNKSPNELITLMVDLSTRLGRVEGAFEMLLMEIKMNIPEFDISTYEKILEEDRV